MPDRSPRRDTHPKVGPPNPELGSTPALGVQVAPGPRQAPWQPRVLTRRRWGWGAAGAQPGTCCRRRVLGPVSAPLGRPQLSPWQGTGTPLLQEGGDKDGISAAAPDSTRLGPRSHRGASQGRASACARSGAPGMGLPGNGPRGESDRGEGAVHAMGRGRGAGGHSEPRQGGSRRSRSVELRLEELPA